MEFQIHQQNGINIAQARGEGILLATAQDALDLLANARHLHDCDRIVVSAENIDPSFFDLRTGVAGEILQKFVNYGARFAVAGDISKYLTDSKALRDFVRESNRGAQIHFADTLEAALAALA